jgi:hypothetical protein
MNIFHFALAACLQMNASLSRASSETAISQSEAGRIASALSTQATEDNEAASEALKIYTKAQGAMTIADFKTKYPRFYNKYIQKDSALVAPNDKTAADYQNGLGLLNRAREQASQIGSKNTQDAVAVAQMLADATQRQTQSKADSTTMSNSIVDSYAALGRSITQQ